MPNEDPPRPPQTKQRTQKASQNNSIKIPPLDQKRRHILLTHHPRLGQPKNEKEPSEDMCKEASNYYKWLFQERPSTDPEPPSGKLRGKALSEPDKKHSIRALP
jgi:hypothetical protein